MNYLILSDYCKTHQYRFISLLIAIAFANILFLAEPSISFAQEDQSIILVTDKDSYLRGQTIQLSGWVNAKAGQLVAIQIKDSAGSLILIRTAQADKDGNFSLQFMIPQTAVSGNFDIVASASIDGFVVTQSKTISATVPELNELTIPVFGLSTLFLILFFNISRKTTRFVILNRITPQATQNVN